MDTVVSINCMAVRTAQKIFQNLAIKIGASSAEAKSIRNASNYIEERLSEDGPMM